MQIVPVRTKAHRRAFLRMVTDIYQGDPYYIRPLDVDIEKVFDPEENKYFRHGECERWILQNDAGKTIGRVAAFINRREAHSFDQPTGGMGFFECIDDQKAAFKLFDTCKVWLEEREMEAMDGPINFGEKNQWWGLLVEGHSEPLYGFNYQPKYYRQFFEDYGFQVYYKQFTYYRKVEGNFKEQYRKRAERILENPDYTLPKFSKKRLDYFIDAFLEIYNKAWVTHEAFQGMRKQQARNLFKQLLPIVDPDMVVFIFYQNEPAGFFINLPDINQIVKHLNGRFDWWGKLKFFYYLKTGACRKLFGMIYGVVPDHQRKGVEAAMAIHAQTTSQRIGRYDDFEMGWLGDFNPSMLKIADMINSRLYKTLITYRKLFDENKPFERRPIIGRRRKEERE